MSMLNHGMRKQDELYNAGEISARRHEAEDVQVKI
jgi:hypothetical protein